MIDFGRTLRQAREQKGMTTRQIAERTHMMVQMVEDLENEEFGRIAAPIYGRGFVKLYCEAVEIDPKPLIAEFMEIFNGNREPTIRRREESVPPPQAPAPVSPVVDDTSTSTDDDGIVSAAAEPEPAPIPAAKPPVQEDPLFAFARPLTPPPAPAAKEELTPPPAPTELVDDSGFAKPARKPSRFAAPMPIDETPRGGFNLSIPPAIWRLLAIVAVAALLLWLIFAGIHALYSALSAPSAATPAESAPTAQPAAEPSATTDPTAAPRKPMDIPPLYID